MNRQYEAYYSQNWAWFWLILAIFSAAGIALFSILWLGSISLTFIIVFSVCILAFIIMYAKTKRQTGIALEIIDDILILHKKETIFIPLREIKRIDIHDAYGSFDIIVRTAKSKVSLHCFIQNQRQKKTTLIDFLKNKNVTVSTYDLL